MKTSVVVFIPFLSPLQMTKLRIQEISREFPGSPVVRILGLHCRGLGSIPGQGTEIPQTTRCGQKKKEKKSSNLSKFIYLVSG